MLEIQLSSLVYEVLHIKMTAIERLSGGCIGEVYRVIAQLAHQSTYSWHEKSKPAYLPRW